MKLTICTPYYDEPIELLERNLESVAKEGGSKYPPHYRTTLGKGYEFEQIVIIDAPLVKDSILELLYSYPNVRVLKHSKNKGLSAARNTVLKEAKGEYFMLLDTDDVCTLGRIEQQIEFMEINNVTHSYGGYMEVHGKNKKPDIHTPIIMPPEFDKQYLLNGQNICYCGSNMIKTEALKSVGGFDENMKEGAEDFEMWIRLNDAGYTSKLFKRTLYFLGVHNNNMTAKLVNNGGFERAYSYIKTKYPNWKFNF